MSTTADAAKKETTVSVTNLGMTVQVSTDQDRFEGPYTPPVVMARELRGTVIIRLEEPRKLILQIAKPSVPHIKHFIDDPIAQLGARFLGDDIFRWLDTAASSQIGATRLIGRAHDGKQINVDMEAVNSERDLLLKGSSSQEELTRAFVDFEYSPYRVAIHYGAGESAAVTVGPSATKGPLVMMALSEFAVAGISTVNPNSASVSVNLLRHNPVTAARVIQAAESERVLAQIFGHQLTSRILPVIFDEHNEVKVLTAQQLDAHIQGAAAAKVGFHTRSILGHIEDGYLANLLDTDGYLRRDFNHLLGKEPADFDRY